MDGSVSVADVDQSALDALRTGIDEVLADMSSSTELHAFIDGKNRLDATLWQRASALGWLGVGIAEEYGGLGLGVHGLDVLHTQLGRHAAPGPYIATLCAAQALSEAADAPTRERWLPRLAAGEISAAIPAAPGGRTVRYLGAADAAIALMPTGDGWGVVELGAGRASAVPLWDRTRSIVEIAADGAAPSAVLKDGAAVTDALIRAMSLAVAADCRGAARSITERTIAYMKTREQFGRPIASFQALKHRAADLVTKLAVIDEIVAQGVEAADAPDSGLWTALAKAEASEAFTFIATDCTQLHGGVGYTWDFDPHVYLKRARLNEMLVATNPALRDRAAAVLAASSRAGRTTLELALS